MEIAEILKYSGIIITALTFIYFLAKLSISVNFIVQTIKELKTMFEKRNEETKKNTKDIAVLEEKCKDLKSDVDVAHSNNRDCEKWKNEIENRILKIETTCEIRNGKEDKKAV